MSTVLILGIGNTLQADDGVGVHVVAALEKMDLPGDVAFRDGGTIGLSLLAEIEDCDSLVVVDAMKLDAKPGTIALYEGDEIQAQLGGKKRTAHEVAVSDLLAAAALMGCTPRHMALVGIQPGRVGWGLEAEGAVAEAIPRACAMVRDLLEKWHVPA
ncbi:MAG: HyaD/HybD family hydrogenase maturation endopeptidase [Sphingomonadales bacterium]|nr:HyaD/HybD family hydrogenase maturation endopeptidase [Sphingomonadales bacterium]MBD3772622.1 HyaD/HybD family hydrogenase maturation endopeptidase [Paracoccaceae bacterium]